VIDTTERRYDVAIVGAGPVGCVCAIAHARKGYRVALFEANPSASKRLAGEWLHPPAVQVLNELGISVEGEVPSNSGEGFAVLPEDGLEPILLPYSDGSRSLVCDHAALLSHLRLVAGDDPGIDLLLHARVRTVEDGRITFTQDDVSHTVKAERIVGADGRSSIVRRSLGLDTQTRTCSRMIGLTLKGVSLPFEGYGHVVSGAPGPMLLYRLSEDRVRAVIDIPLDHAPQEWKGLLSDSYARWVPKTLRSAFIEAWSEQGVQAAANVISPRLTYGTSRRVLIGDAAGHYHPLTATGITLGFGDALALAEGEKFSDFRNHRFEATRVPELLAMGLYEAFADPRDEGAAMRQAMYSRWRASSGVRGRTMRLLGSTEALPRAVFTSMPSGSAGHQRAAEARRTEATSPDAGPALQRDGVRLLDLQDEDGGWEGEMVWCPMITAQWVLLHHIIGRPIDPERRRQVLRYFESSRFPDGTWGLHDHSQPYLFVTTLVYVASRLLGVERDDPLVEPARRFLHAEGVLGIPSWGKFWLALLNLYDWNGLHPVLPELWSLPQRLPFHPSNWYCHTRLIYTAMASIYARRFQAPVTPLISSLREELFPQGFEAIDFPAHRSHLRRGDLFAKPTAWLRALYGAAGLVERFHGKGLRKKSVDELVSQVKWELNTTDHTSISPVSGLLNIIALWLHDPDDEDGRRALDQAELWFCFAAKWHGWPVSDCTAEAVLGILEAEPQSTNADALRDAVRFMLRAQNRDGGFGSYEAQRSGIDLERINPAEMFGESMTEHSYVECTASCLAALAACREHFPEVIDEVAQHAMARADVSLRRTQASDGSWRGVRGVQYIYGTLFGIRGLIAGGAQPGDPALRSACRWLLERQREDGGWGEHHSGCMTGQYVAHDQSQVIQTAWALIALLEAGESDWTAISLGIRFLIDTQNPDGTWPTQDMAGVFFRTALLDYVLYRQYFPLHALGLYEQRRKGRRN